jgi:beta-glucosidase
VSTETPRLPPAAAARPGAGRSPSSGQASSGRSAPGRFRDDFVWGSGTSSYQIEGSPLHDGGGESVWDVFANREGAIKDKSSGDVACDHYRRYRDDVALMKQFELGAYRFSLSWPRLFPEGTGRRNEAGFAFYDRLIDELLAAGVTPWITLFHWDLPQALQQRGGWMVRESSDWFADYAEAAITRYSDRVKHWFTHNEPEVFIFLGHHLGTHAPGEKRPWADILQISHHVMLAHGKAVQVMRAKARQPIEIGYVSALWPGIPASDSPADLEAARRATFGGLAGWLLEPVYRGEYPAQQLIEYGDQVPRYDPADLKIIAQPLDFFAMNTYQGNVIRADAEGKPQIVPPPPGNPRTSFWVFDVLPESLYWGPRWYYERYGLPIYVTENGMSLTDWVSLDGRVDDPRHGRRCRRARLFRLEPAGQLRMGRRLSGTLRTDPCRLCHPEAHAETFVRVVSRDDSRQRGEFVGAGLVLFRRLVRTLQSHCASSTQPRDLVCRLAEYPHQHVVGMFAKDRWRLIVRNGRTL